MLLSGYTQNHKEIVIDFTGIENRAKGKRFLLVVVAYSGWPEGYPTYRGDAEAVIKALINHYIPTHGFPKRIRSDNGSHFKNHHMAEVENMLGLKHQFGSVYHPQSQGKVERMNLNIKNKLAKVMKETGVNWIDALPLVLMSIRHSINRVTGYTPFELQHGRPPPHPWGPVGPATACNPKVISKMANYFSTSLSPQIAPAKKSR